MSPVFPPIDLWKLRLLLLNMLKSISPAVAVGTAKEKFPEIVAVGIPPARLIKANFADEVDVPPKAISSVELFG